jgi:hypothetical protein
MLVPNYSRHQGHVNGTGKQVPPLFNDLPKEAKQLKGAANLHTCCQSNRKSVFVHNSQTNMWRQIKKMNNEHRATMRMNVLHRKIGVTNKKLIKP